MISFDNIEIPITKQEILSKVKIIDLWYFYCTNFKTIDTSFISDLYDDTNPSCRVLISNTGNLYYRDFGEGHYFKDIFEYLMFKFNAKFHEVLNIIASDFGLRNNKIDDKVKSTILELGQIKNSYIKVKSEISVVEQGWNIVDYNFWQQFGISFELLDKYNVKSVKSATLIKENKIYSFNSSKSNPKYVYYFDTGLKVYSPLANKREKWLCNGSFVEGYSQLDNKADLLIITSSLKDVMVYRLLGVNAIASSSENNIFDKEIIDKLKLRFTNIIVNMDNDLTGITCNKLYKEKYNLDWFLIDNYKDISDGVKEIGLEKMKEEINEKTKNTIYLYCK